MRSLSRMAKPPREDCVPLDAGGSKDDGEGSFAARRTKVISRIHGKLGTAGFVISIVALVAALGGGAYAASGGLTGKQKKEVEKIAKKYAGKPGPAGPSGPTGPGGAKGDSGAKGDAGAAGANGTNGTNGTNGLTGFTESLPSEKTETGTWSYETLAEGVTTTRFPISFPIPLAEGTQVDVHYIALVRDPVSEELEPGQPTQECPGSAAAPEAAPGNLCIYETLISTAGTATSGNSFDPISAEGGIIGTAGKAGSVGSLITLFGLEEGNRGVGDWAVTAP